MDEYFNEELKNVQKAVEGFPQEARATATQILLTKLIAEFDSSHRLVTHVFRTKDAVRSERRDRG